MTRVQELVLRHGFITTSGGSVTLITITIGGSGYMTPGIKKFVDALPGLCLPRPALATGREVCPSRSA